MGKGRDRTVFHRDDGMWANKRNAPKSGRRRTYNKGT